MDNVFNHLRTTLLMTAASAAIALAGCTEKKDDAVRRADELMEKMTLAEKIGQLSAVPSVFPPSDRK